MEVVTRQALTAPALTATARRAATKAARSAGPRSPLALGLLIALFARDRKVLATLLAVGGLVQIGDIRSAYSVETP